MMDPKPSPRVIDPAGVRVKLHRARRCRLCNRRPGEPIMSRGADGRLVRRGTVPPLTAHHLVPRSQGGDDVPDNIVALCGDGVRGCHGAIEAWRPGARSALRRRLRREESAYAIGRRGEGWLDRAYPLQTP